MALISNGTTIFDAGSMASGFGGAMTFIKKLTASSSGTLSFVDGTSSVVLDNTYKEYLFVFNNIHPATDGVYFSFQGNAAGGSGFDETITSSFFTAFHGEDGSGAELEIAASRDQSQGTGIQNISDTIGNDNDQSLSGHLRLFDPSSTTFVKHFIATTNVAHPSNFSMNSYSAGYFNTTSAIDEIQFSMNSGNIDSGTISLFGIN
jgi:hypothetical protein